VYSESKCPGDMSICIRMDYCPLDLGKLIDDKSFEISETDAIIIFKQILEAVDYLNQNYLIHRDIKPPNILLSSLGKFILTDFGLTRQLPSPGKEMTTGVVTRWYRAPELLFGSSMYGPKIDIWALGCLFVELFIRKPLFPGTSDIDQLGRIFSVRGTPTPETWSDVNQLPCYFEFETTQKIPLQKLINGMSNQLAEIIDEMLELDPNKRPTTFEIIQKINLIPIKDICSKELEKRLINHIESNFK